MNDDFLRQLLDISRRMSETRDLDPLLRYAVEMAMSLLGAEIGYIVLMDDEHRLEFRVKLSLRNHALTPEEEGISMTIFESVMAAREARLISDAQAMFGKASSVRSLNMRSVLVAPLITSHRAIGAIWLENRSLAGVFPPEAPQALMYFASHAAVAIESALVNDHLEALVAARTAELQRAVEQVERSWLAALEANRVRTQLLSGIAHDLRSPIGLAVSAIETIREGTFGELQTKQEEWLRRAADALRGAIALTQDLLDLSKAELDKLVLYPEQVDLAVFLRHIYAIGQTVSWHTGVSFQANIPDDLPPLALDPTRIQQVMVNLLTNAQKFTRQGSVTLHARAHADAVVIGVRDTGVGIAPEQQAQLFERFFQAHQEADTLRLGTGLGLAICKELVERHGGRIWVESALGQGADFMFSLPL